MLRVQQVLCMETRPWSEAREAPGDWFSDFIKTL